MVIKTVTKNGTNNNSSIEKKHCINKRAHLELTRNFFMK